MAKTVQLRNVPDELYRKLTARAALAGMSLSKYILQEIERSLEHPMREELLERLRLRQRVEPAEPVVEAVRAEREGR
jgi:antitoxin FitA